MAAAHRLNLPQLRREQQNKRAASVLSEQICRPKRPLLAPIRACEAAEPRVLVEEAGRALPPSIRSFGLAELTSM